ncbi:MAG: hypothetical protein ACPGLY_01800 [Rubripirellula sp.]
MIFKLLKTLPAFVLRTPTFDSAAEPNLARVFGIGSTLDGVAAARAVNTVIIIEQAIRLGEAISSGMLRREDQYEDQYEESSNAGDEE